MELTKGFVQHCNKPSVLREFLLQAMEQNEKLEAENAALREEHRWRWFSEEMPKDGEIVWLYNKSLNQIVKGLHYGEGRFVLATDHGCAFDPDLWMPMNTPKAPEDT